MKRLVQIVLSVLVSALILSALARRFDVHQTFSVVRTAKPGFLFTGIALMVVAYLLRGARWLIWERRLRYWDSLRLVLIGFMGNNVLPARLGEIVRAHCAVGKTGESGDRRRTATLASIAAERILDGLVLAVFGIVSIGLITVDRRLEWTLLLVSLVFTMLGVAVVVGVRHDGRIRALVAAGHRRFPGHVTKYAGDKINQFVDGFLPLNSLTRLLAAVGATVVIWGIEIGFCYCVGRSVWTGMTVPAALLLLVVVNFASLVPFTMGGVGTIEAVAPVFLMSAGVAPSAALAIVLLQHASQYFFTTTTGGLVYLAGGFYRIPLTGPQPVPQQSPSIVEGTQHSNVMDETRSRLGESGLALKPAETHEVDLTIVIPAYNEQARLPRTVLETMRWCTTRAMSFELIIADDGSRDATLALARLFEQSDMRIRALACPHMGKGATVRMGVLNAKGRAILFMDADGATPLDEIPKLFSALASGRDVAIGSRVAQHSDEVVVQTRAHRRFIGRVFALFVNLFAMEGIADTQCGFKMFRRPAAEAVFSQQRLAGFAFDVEVLFIARRLGFSIEEIPVNWVAQPGSKVNLVTDSMKMLWDIGHIRWMHRDLRTRNADRAATATT